MKIVAIVIAALACSACSGMDVEPWDRNILARDMGGKVLDVSYRFMIDDWEIDSNTIELRYRLPVRRSS